MPNGQNNFRVGLVQMSCSPDPDENLDKAAGRVREAARARRADRLPAGAVSLAVFLPARGRRAVRPRRAHSRASTRSAGGASRERRSVVVVASLFERRAAGLYHNTAVVSTPTARSPACIARCTSPTIRSTTRNFTSRRAIWAFGAFDTAVGAHRRAGLLGPVVSRRRAAHRAAGRRDSVLSDGHRLASRGEGRVRRRAARRVADHPALACDRQRRLCRGGQSRRPRRDTAATARRARVLGRLVRRRSVRTRHREGVARQGRDSDRRVRPALHRR